MTTDEDRLALAIDTVQAIVHKTIADMGRDWAWLDFGKNYVPHDYQFESGDFFNFLKKRKYRTYDDAQKDGWVPRTKDFFLLTSQFLHRLEVLKADQKMIVELRRGRTNDGAPLVMNDASHGYQPVGLREFRVVNPSALEKLKAEGSLDCCFDRGMIFEAQSEVYVEIIEFYAHPDIASHLKRTLADTYSAIMAEWNCESRDAFQSQTPTT